MSDYLSLSDLIRCSSCKAYLLPVKFWDDEKVRMMKCCEECRIKHAAAHVKRKRQNKPKLPSVRKQKIDHARPPQSVIEFNRLWTPTRI